MGASQLIVHGAQGAAESLAAVRSAQEVPAKAPTKRKQPKRKADSADLAAHPNPPTKPKKPKRKQASL